MTAVEALHEEGQIIALTLSWHAKVLILEKKRLIEDSLTVSWIKETNKSNQTM